MPDSALPTPSAVGLAAASGDPIKFRGIIQRSDWKITPVPAQHVGFMQTMTFAKITDGTSKTLLVAEKRVAPSLYEPTSDNSTPGDNRGWADGWDYDQLRSTMFPLEPDGDGPGLVILHTDRWNAFNYQFGSAHPGGMNAIFADGSVTSISFDIDRETFNRLGGRADGEAISQSY